MDSLEWEQAKLEGKVGRTCPPFWDTISCWPPVAEGGRATISCFSHLRGVAYDSSKSAHLACLSSHSITSISTSLETNTSPWPVWANKSDYSECRPLKLPEDEESLSEVTHSDSLSHIYFTGYSLSLVTLIMAFIIFLYFKEIRCLRNKIHSNLFLTFILANTCWILTAIMQSIHFSSSSVEFSWCVSLIFLRYFHLATFFWMFVEGLFLFLQVIATFSVGDSRMKFRHYFLIGWGSPLLVVCLWAVFTQRKVLEQRQWNLQNMNSTQVFKNQCPFLERTSLEWIYIGPVLLLLAANAFFLISIFYVVVAKLRSSGQGEPADHQNWKAAKALLVIIPLLGITYLITILGPTDSSSVSYSLFVHIRAVLLSTQGFTVTLPYCFLNTEVKGILYHNWKRWRNKRNVEHTYSRGQSARNSISLAGYYGCDSNSTFLSTSRRNSFIRLHSQYLSGSQAQRNQESHLVTSVILERNDPTGQQSNRIIPVIQEELRTPSPSVYISRSASPALLTINNQVSPTVISVTPATPSHPKIRITISDNSSDLVADLTSESLDQKHRLSSCSPHFHDRSGLSPDSLSCHSVHSSPGQINVCQDHLKHSVLDLGVAPKKKTNSLIDLDDPLEDHNPNHVSTTTIPSHAMVMPDMLYLPSPTLSVSCPTVYRQ